MTKFVVSRKKIIIKHNNNNNREERIQKKIQQTFFNKPFFKYRHERVSETKIKGCLCRISIRCVYACVYYFVAFAFGLKRFRVMYDICSDSGCVSVRAAHSSVLRTVQGIDTVIELMTLWLKSWIVKGLLLPWPVVAVSVCTARLSAIAYHGRLDGTK